MRFVDLLQRHLLWRSLFCIAVLTLACSAGAQPQNTVIGKVVLVRGAVTAHTANDETRPLQRRSEIFAGDTIVTDAGATAQLRMIDGAIFSLQESSEFSFETYQVAGRDQQEKAVMKMLKGGLRTITGTIGHDDKDSYELQTGVATIGIRGTTYQVAYETPTTLVAAAWQGGIRMRSDGGDIDLGIGAPFNFARLRLGNKPQGLLEPPAKLLTNVAPQTNEPATDDNTDDDQSPQNSGDDTQAQNNNGDDQPDDTQGTTVSADDQQTTVADSDDTTDVSTELTADGGGAELLTTSEPVNDSLSLAGSGSDATIDTAVDTTLTDTTTTTTVNPADSGTGTGAIDASAIDPRLSNTEIASLDRLGMIVGAQLCIPTCSPKFGSGLSGDAATGGQIVLDNGVPLGDPSYGTLPAPRIMRGDTSLAIALNTTVVGGSPVSWGIWLPTPTTPLIVQDSLTDPTSSTQIVDPVLFASIIPSNATVLTGSFHYGTPIPFYSAGTVIDSLIDTPLTGIALDDVAFDVDFGTGFVSNGELDFVLASGDFIITDFAGQVFGPKLDLNFTLLGREDSVGNLISSNSPGVQDTIAGIITGANGDGALLGFGFIDQFSGNPIAGFALLGQGQLGVANPDPQDPRLSTSDVTSLNRLGLVVGSQPCIPSCQPKFAGGLSSDAAAGAPIILDNLVPLSDTNFGAYPAPNIIRGDASLAGMLSTNTVGGTAVSWGVWAASPTNPIYVQDSPTDPGSALLITEKTLFASAMPTSGSLLTTGNFRYGPYPGGSGGGTVIDYVIESPANIVALDNVGFDVDFSTGTIGNGIMDFKLASGEFIITDFVGSMFGGKLVLNFVSMGRDDAMGNPIASYVPGVQDTLGGFVTGANGEGALLGFSFIDQYAGDPVAGFALIGQGTATSDLRLTSAEKASIDRVGLVLGVLDPCPPPSTQCAPKLGGGAMSDAVSGTPIVTDNGVAIGMAGFSALPATDVIRPGSSNNYVETPSTEVSWGLWADTASASSATRTSTAYSQTDLLDPLVTSPLNETIFFASVIPTDPSLLTGSFTYSNVLSDFIWTDSGGTLVRTGGITSQFDVDFNTGVISNGSFSLSSPGISANFDGMVAVENGSAYLSLNLIDINGGAPLNQDSIGGVFTGPNGEYALMGLSLLDPGTAIPLAGYYLLGR